MTCILWLLSGKSTYMYVNGEMATFVVASEFNVSSIPNEQMIIVEDNQSVVACGWKCLNDDHCIGFGFIYQPSTICLAVRSVPMQPGITQSLEGYTYFSRSNKGEDRFSAKPTKIAMNIQSINGLV